MRATDRARVLEESLLALSNGISEFAVETEFSFDGRHHLMIDLALTEGSVARSADLLFHGSPDALQCNGHLFIESGLLGLADGIAAFRDRAWARRRHRRKRDRMRGARR